MFRFSMKILYKLNIVDELLFFLSGQQQELNNKQETSINLFIHK